MSTICFNIPCKCFILAVHLSLLHRNVIRCHRLIILSTISPKRCDGRRLQLILSLLLNYICDMCWVCQQNLLKFAKLIFICRLIEVAVKMGRHFGNLGTRVNGLIYYTLSPMEQKAFAGYFTKSVPNFLRRIQSQILRVGPRKFCSM